MMEKYQQRLSNLLRINELSIARKLRVLIVFFLSILTIMVAYTETTLFQQKNDGLVVNIAGRQRMLTQNSAKNFFLLSSRDKNVLK